MSQTKASHRNGMLFYYSIFRNFTELKQKVMKVYISGNELIIEIDQLIKSVSFGTASLLRFSGGKVDLIESGKSIINGGALATELEDADGNTYASQDDFYTAIQDSFSQEAPGISPLNVISQFYKNSAGSEDIHGTDYSTVNDDFYIEVPEGEIWYMERALLFISGGNASFSSGNFGPIDELANGVQLGVLKDGVEYFYEDLVWTKNSDIAATMYDYEDKFRDGTAVGRWTFSKAASKPIELNAGDRQFFRMRDDLSASRLTDFRIIANGFKKTI